MSIFKFGVSGLPWMASYQMLCFHDFPSFSNMILCVVVVELYISTGSSSHGFADFFRSNQHTLVEIHVSFRFRLFSFWRLAYLRVRQQLIASLVRSHSDVSSVLGCIVCMASYCSCKDIFRIDDVQNSNHGNESRDNVIFQHMFWL